jgi:soluble lytic murein transglycosylase-like protein
MMGATTRLFTDETNYIDVPTTEISQTVQSEEPVKVAPEIQSKPADLNAVVKAASDKHLIDADFIAAVIRAESNFNPKARSAKGAQGLMQLMPGTASQLGVSDPYDPSANVNAGTLYLSHLLTQYNGDAVKALAAYNAGPARVNQYRGVPPFRETRSYVARIVKEFNQKKLAAKKAESKTTPGKPKSTNVQKSSTASATQSGK